MIQKVIAIYPGRFQPFGKHHYESFQWLQKQFGKSNTYIATSNVINPHTSPFTFKEKKDIIGHYGIGDRLVQVKNPYKSEEILLKYDPKTTAVVFMVGEKDMKSDPRFTIGVKKDGNKTYYQDYKSNKNQLQGFDKHGYLIVAPHTSIAIPGIGEMSGTTLRKVLSSKQPRSKKIQQFTDIFGWYDKKTADMIFDKMENLSENVLFSKNWWSESLTLNKKNVYQVLHKQTNNIQDKSHVLESYADEFPKNKFIQLSSTKLRQYAEEIIQLISQAYAEKGGNHELQSASDLNRTDLTYWISNDIDSDPDADVVLGGKQTPAGVKVTVAGQDGSKEARKSVLTKMSDLMKKKGFYAEMDFDLAKKMQLNPINDESIVKNILRNKSIEWNGNGTYKREIAGKTYTKVMVGVPKTDSVREGYMSTKILNKHNKKISSLKSFLSSNQNKEFVYNFDKFPKTVFGVSAKDLQENLLFEGGAAGHMNHPFNIDWVKTGKDLVKVFVQAVEYLKKGPASVKIDGINASIRLITLNNKKVFVMDRGSNKPLDVQGITKSELENRFGPGHGMIKIGGTVLDIFNESIPKITPALKSLGLWDNPNIMLNLEYVAGSTNVLSYNKNFLAIHGLLEIEQVTEKRRTTKEIKYSKVAMQNLLNNLVPAASKNGYEVLGSIPTTLSGEPNLAKELNKKYTVNYGDRKETKTLSQWLAKTKIPDTEIKTVDGKKISALSKDVLIKISEGTPLSKYIENPKDYDAAVSGFVTYMATMKLGDAILEKLNSPLGPVSEHEGIVIRDTKISKKPFKITGKFILGGLATSFRK